ncbi:S-adenosyl-L-methionine-dependent methyltransferase [Ephemerocybe angulata]|uniref:S-adenosyl-L-methionine-dependent methyltransferase n=1 Tax=Ephemerocybe angulata TaxID=980116 RepID=A0A8H6HXI3_9AGAR|nr:S-adenosyl-L-methionine-dependent methyltransferase [Tulosesus angulatus]
MDPQQSHLAALVALITNATQLVETRFKTSAQPYVPTLDDTEEHPLDKELSDPALRAAIQTIEGACAQLCATVARPSHTIVNVLAPHCLNVVTTFKIADILEERPEGMHVKDLGARVGIDPEKLGRILRLLATRHVFREVTDDVFANNRLSVQLLSTNPISSLGLHFTEEAFGSASFLTQTLADPEWGTSRDPRKTAFNKYTKYEGSLFEYFEGGTPLGAAMGQRFGVAMVGWGTAIEAGNVVYEYPWDKLPHGASVCDVGAGIGSITLQLAKAHPHLKLKLQDLPERVVQARDEVWPKQCPEAIAEDRIEFEAIDFFTESPIAGCDVYYLKNIIHNWLDGPSIKILSGIRKVMGPNSRVLIHEYILQHATPSSAKIEPSSLRHKQAPAELLSNYGAGRIRQYNLDLVMMSLLNAQERTLEDFVELGEASGLEFVKLWDFGEMSAVEFKLAGGVAPE